MKSLSSLFLFITFCHCAFSQYQIGLVPRVSPDKGIYQKIGNTEVNIKYGSPKVKNRTIWGDLVPYDVVWRAGANKATTIEFSSDVTISGKLLNKGIYSFFIIPIQHDKWLAVFNSVPDQWGAFDYDETKDMLQVEVLPKVSSVHQENLTYSIKQYGFNHGEIILAWDYLSLEIEFNTNYLDQFTNEIESRAAKADNNTKWVVYLQGAEHLEQLNSKLDMALEWVEKSELLSKDITEWNKQFYPQEYIMGHLYWTKAKLMARMDDYKNAIDFANQMMNIGDKPLYYNRKNRREHIDEKLAEWKAD